MIVHCAMVEGRMLDGTRVSATVSIPALGLTDQLRDRVVSVLIKDLEHRHPGVIDLVQVGDWVEYDMPEDEGMISDG